MLGQWSLNTSISLLQMERLAKRQYLEKRDLKACALPYIALNMLQVLAGLFKINKYEKDKPLVAFLSRNFQVSSYSTIALSITFVMSVLNFKSSIN